MSVIDFDGPVPVYVQLADILRGQIGDGTIPPDRPIPSKRTLIETYGVGARTVDRAIDLLRADGLLVTVRGKGLYVVRPGELSRVVPASARTGALRPPGQGSCLPATG